MSCSNSQPLPRLAEADVLVAGGGIAGIMAALAAARHGRSVTLLEAGYSVGGIAANGPLEALMTFHDESGQTVHGIPAEFVDRMIAANASPGHQNDTVGYCRTVTPYDAEGLKYVAAAMLQEAGIQTFLNTLVVGANVSNGILTEVATESVSGRKAVAAKAFVDCTGDGALALAAGAEVWRGREQDGKTQPVTLLVRVGGVNIPALRQYVKDNAGDFMFAPGADLDARYLHLWGFGRALEEGYAKNALSLRRKEIHAMLTPAEGEIILNYSRVPANPYDVGEMSRAQFTALRQVHELVDWFRQSIPAFAECRIVQTGRVGIRESGRIKGCYVLTEDDIVNSREFTDTVAHGSFPVDIHQPDGDSMVYRRITKAYSIPAGALHSADVSNLFMAGRCISATHEAIASARIAVTCMATGEAAGRLAAEWKI